MRILLLFALILALGCLSTGEKSEKPSDGTDRKIELPPPITINIIAEYPLGDFGKIKNVTLLSKEVIKGKESYSFWQATYYWKGIAYRTGALNRFYPEEKEVLPLLPPGKAYSRAFEWIKNNTSEDAVFISWWDYGDLIRVFAQREALISDPCSSERCANTISDDETDVFKYEDQEKFDDIVRFFTSDEEDAYKIAKKYRADYVFVTYEEFPKSWAIEYIAGSQPSLRYFEVPLTGDGELDTKNIANGLVKYRVSAYFFKPSEDRYTVWYLIPEDTSKIKENMLLSLLPLKIMPDNTDTRDMLNNFQLVYTDAEEYIYIFKVMS